MTDKFVEGLAAALRILPCPLCGGTLEATPAETEETYHPGYHDAAKPLPTRVRSVMTIACTGCEYMVEVTEGGGVKTFKGGLR